MKVKVVIILVIVVGAVLAIFFANKSFGNDTTAENSTVGEKSQNSDQSNSQPLAGVKFYVDNSRPVTKLASSYESAGISSELALIKKISTQPGSTWLTGPNASDAAAARDIQEVLRTSQEADQQKTTPIYILYAIPKRDACAEYSAGGFKTAAAYVNWINQITSNLKTSSVFVVEPDAVAQTINSTCLSNSEVSERYQLIKQTVDLLTKSPNAKAVYIDAGHSEWFNNSDVLVEPLQKSGIDLARGVSTNISYFIATQEISDWTSSLVEKLGGNKGAIIDTSRNGKGVAPASVTGEARWCNPAGRGIGRPPTTSTSVRNIDAYFWGKNIGESDGSCFGNPSAGTFVPAAALELARNAAT